VSLAYKNWNRIPFQNNIFLYSMKEEGQDKKDELNEDEQIFCNDQAKATLLTLSPSGNPSKHSTSNSEEDDGKKNSNEEVESLFEQLNALSPNGTTQVKMDFQSKRQTLKQSECM
jgi:hypothetical protein